MEYIHRTLERKFMSMSSAFKAVMVVGARQVGKSTMLKYLARDQNRTYVTLDNMKVRALAQTDPELFFQMYKPPILIDEVQKAPELFEYIKIMCDESDEKGLFWLSGSQSKKLIKYAGDWKSLHIKNVQSVRKGNTADPNRGNHGLFLEFFDRTLAAVPGNLYC